MQWQTKNTRNAKQDNPTQPREQHHHQRRLSGKSSEKGNKKTTKAYAAYPHHHQETISPFFHFYFEMGAKAKFFSVLGLVGRGEVTLPDVAMEAGGVVKNLGKDRETLQNTGNEPIRRPAEPHRWARGEPWSRACPALQASPVGSRSPCTAAPSTPSTALIRRAVPRSP